MIRSRWYRGAGPFLLLIPAAQLPSGKPTEILGLWSGKSLCTDRVAAPACRDESVIYEFTAGKRPGTVHWKADKLVDGRREAMGDTDLTYDVGAGCWQAEFRSPRVHGVWCLSVSGTHLSGTGRLLPRHETVRRVEVQRVERADR